MVSGQIPTLVPVEAQIIDHRDDCDHDQNLPHDVYPDPETPDAAGLGGRRGAHAFQRRDWKM